MQTAQWKLGLIAFGAVLAAACATIVSGTKQEIRLDSHPPAARVEITRLTGGPPEWEGVTPAKVKLSRQNSHLVTISLPGYQTVETEIETDGTNGWVWGNLVFGGIIGMLVDGLTGAWYDLKPDEISVQLVAVPNRTSGERAGLYAVLRISGASC